MQGAQLVMFVGAGVRPSVRVSAQMLRRHVRSVWVSSLNEACRSGRMIRFDALVVDASLIEAAGTMDIHQLRQALRCPLLLLSDVADEIDEIIMLELGADAYLVKPVNERRLLAHLMALLRRHGDTSGLSVGQLPAAPEFIAV